MAISKKGADKIRRHKSCRQWLKIMYKQKKYTIYILEMLYKLQLKI